MAEPVQSAPLNPMSTPEDPIGSKLDACRDKADRTKLLIEFNKLRMGQALHEKRRAVLNSIPKFWSTILMAHTDISPRLTHAEDREMVELLEDIWVVRDSVDPRLYTIEFKFKKNPYFEDEVLKKVFKLVRGETPTEVALDAEGFRPSMLDFDWDRDVKAQPTSINWKEGMNLCLKYPKDGEDDFPKELGSFFNWFALPTDAHLIGMVIVEDIFGDAIDYFLGEFRDKFDEEPEPEAVVEGDTGYETYWWICATLALILSYNVAGGGF